MLQAQTPVLAMGARLLMPGSLPPASFKPLGKTVCQCFNVAQSQISEVLQTLKGSPVELLEQLQRQLECGSNCGSCVPELKRMVLEECHVQVD